MPLGRGGEVHASEAIRADRRTRARRLLHPFQGELLPPTQDDLVDHALHRVGRACALVPLLLLPEVLERGCNLRATLCWEMAAAPPPSRAPAFCWAPPLRSALPCMAGRSDAHAKTRGRRRGANHRKCLSHARCERASVDGVAGRAREQCRPHARTTLVVAR